MDLYDPDQVDRDEALRKLMRGGFPAQSARPNADQLDRSSAARWTGDALFGAGGELPPQAVNVGDLLLRPDKAQRTELTDFMRAVQGQEADTRPFAPRSDLRLLNDGGGQPAAGFDLNNPESAVSEALTNPGRNPAEVFRDEAQLRNAAPGPVDRGPPLAPPSLLPPGMPLPNVSGFFGDVAQGMKTQPIAPGLVVPQPPPRPSPPAAGDSTPPPAVPAAPAQPAAPQFVQPDPAAALAAASGAAPPPAGLQPGPVGQTGVRYIAAARPGFSPIIKGFDQATGTFINSSQLPEEYRNANLAGQLADAGGGYMAQQINADQDAKQKADTALQVAGVKAGGNGPKGDADRSQFVKKFIESRAAQGVPIAQARSELNEYLRLYDETGGKKPLAGGAGVGGVGGGAVPPGGGRTATELAGDRFRRLLPSSIGGKATSPEYARTRAALETLPGASDEEIGGLASMVAGGEFGDPEAIAAHIAESAARDYARYGVRSEFDAGPATVAGPDAKPLFTLISNRSNALTRGAAVATGGSAYNEIHLPNGQIIRPDDGLRGPGLSYYSETDLDRKRNQAQMTAAAKLLSRVRQIQADAQLRR